MPLDYLEEISSTNEYIKQNLKNYTSDFSGVYTFNQTHGKGVRSNVWKSEPGKNIAMTFCLSDKKELISLVFWIPLVVREFIQLELHEQKTFIKWPNDIIVENKKVCGILIEKVNNTFIIGIGINVLQEKFEFDKAGSLFNFLPKKYNLKEMVVNLMGKFILQENKLNYFQDIFDDYNNFLFLKNRVRTFRIQEKFLAGIIRGVNEKGLLLVEFEDSKIEQFRLKEIELLY